MIKKVPPVSQGTISTQFDSSIIPKKISSIKNYTMDTPATKRDISKAASLILEMSLAELKTVVINPNTPLFVVGFAGAALTDMKRGDVKSINSLMEWAYGKPDQMVTANGALSITQEVVSMSIAERQEMKDKLLKEQGYEKVSNTVDGIMKTREVMSDLAINLIEREIAARNDEIEK